jgi:hypothetical protein
MKRIKEKQCILTHVFYVLISMLITSCGGASFSEKNMTCHRVNFYRVLDDLTEVEVFIEVKNNGNKLLAYYVLPGYFELFYNEDTIRLSNMANNHKLFFLRKGYSGLFSVGTKYEHSVDSIRSLDIWEKGTLRYCIKNDKWQDIPLSDGVFLCLDDLNLDTDQLLEENVSNIVKIDTTYLKLKNFHVEKKQYGW